MRRNTALLLLPAMLMCLNASAVEEAADSLYGAIDEVVVAVSHIDRSTVPAQELGGEELKRMSVYSVADALRYFSGVQIKDYGGIGGLKTVNVRSMGSEHVGVFYDGIQLDNAQNGTVDLGRYSLDNMESITMYNGQKNSIFQSAKSFASASTICLQSRRPQFEAEYDADGSLLSVKRDNLKAGMKYGSFDTWNPSLLWEHGFSERLSGSVSAELLSTSGEYKFRLARKNGYDTTMVRQNGDVRAARAELSLYGNTERDIWSAKAYLYSSERGYPGAVVRGIPGKYMSKDRQWDTNLFVQGRWQRSVSGIFSTQLQMKYAYDYLHFRSDPEADASTMYVDNVYRQHEAYLSAVQMLAITDWWSASLSTDFEMNSLNGSVKDMMSPVRYSALAALSSAWEWNRLKAQASLLYTFVDDRDGMKVVDGTKNRFTPTLVLSWQPFADADWNLRAFYKRIFRLPTLNDLYYTVVGERPLRPEFTTQFDIGTSWTLLSGSGVLRSVDIQADAYFNQVDDKIVAMPSSSQFRWTMMNIGHVEIFGVDASLQSGWRVGGTSHGLRLSYTYQRAQDRTDSRSMWYGGQIPYIPLHSGSVAYSGDWRGWSWNYSFIYTGERYESVANIPENHEQPWYTHDMSVSRTIPLRKCALRATLEVNNILNQQYDVVRCYPMPGTNWRIRLELTL